MKAFLFFTAFAFSCAASASVLTVLDSSNLASFEMIPHGGYLEIALILKDGQVLSFGGYSPSASEMGHLELRLSRIVRGQTSVYAIGNALVCEHEIGLIDSAHQVLMFDRDIVACP